MGSGTHGREQHHGDQGGDGFKERLAARFSGIHQPVLSRASASRGIVLTESKKYGCEAEPRERRIRNMLPDGQDLVIWRSREERSKLMHIAIITLGSRGDVQPYVALGKGLRKAGYAVRVVTHPPFEELVRGEGVDFASLEGDPGALVASHFQGNTSRQPVWLPKRVIAARDTFRSGRGMMEAIMQGMQETTERSFQASQDADVLLLSGLGILVGIPVAQKLRIPALVSYVQPMTLTAAFPPSVLFPPAPPWLAAVRPSYNLVSGKIVEWFYRQMMSKQPMGKAQQVLHLPVQAPPKHMRPPGTPIVYGYSPSFLPPPRDWPAYCHVTGYWFLDKEQDWQPDASLLNFLRAGSPPVYIGFGSMIDRDPAAMTNLAIQALERSGQRGILLTGGGGALSPERVPDYVFLLDAIPHDWLFPRVSAVVHHGGAGTTGAGLRAGKPTLIVSFISDQRFWGEQVYERGVGPKPIAHQHLSAETLAEGIKIAVTDEAIRAKAEALGEKIRAEDGVGKTIEVFSHYLQGLD